ncbi:hypothetical protein KR215_009085 [Drosophila sulfurigaster]|nr:hypothetical protein KR215_009085 [Drosophila sulfurigaster]
MHRRQFKKHLKEVLEPRRKSIEIVKSKKFSSVDKQQQTHEKKPKTTTTTTKREINAGKHLQHMRTKPVAFLEVVVHWTRSERQKYKAIKLLPPW